MTKRLKLLDPLEDEQKRASDPIGHAALSASAGTGKTHVVTARVLRLLLHGVDPSAILCLTFTKAGAAEMAERINTRLAHWVRLKDQDLSKELFALGEPHKEPEDLAKARTLFAKVLDAKGGGLRILTIHAFAQSLLAAFPAEAGLVPGFRPLEGREEQLLARRTLADLLVRAEAEGDLGLVGDLQVLSHRLGEGGAEAMLLACGRAPTAMESLGPREGIEARLRRAFGLPAGDIDELLAAACCDDEFDTELLERIAAANRAWGTATGLNCCEIIAAWLAGDQAARGAGLEALAGIVLKKDGEPRSIASGLIKADPDYAEHAAALAECCGRLLQVRRTAALVAALAAGLRAGQSFARAYGEAKRAAGVVDFDDLIRWTETLLLTPGMGDWVRYKLDQATDHILVDEAQDTNARQWRIVEALTEEFFAGEGASGRPRTIFTVGDFKQAIFGFQGTDPREFERTRAYFEAKARAVLAAAIELDLPEQRLPPDFLDLSMDRSFRSSPQILDAVDRIIADLGHEALGLPRAPNRHETKHESRAGSVTLWLPYSEEAAQTEDEAGEEGWISDTVRLYAGKLARQIRRWLESPFMVESKGRPLRPEDILILVRRRGDLASLIVARLHAEGVPVAGVDRLLLTAPLAVRDLLAAARFAVQPLDDLNLAGLLVSPLFGWSQDELFGAAFRRDGRLWPRLRELGAEAGKHGPELEARIAETLAGLQDMLKLADYATPQLFLETLLSGPLDAVRVMTVHGSKGLQSPVVILADACADPDRRGGGFRGTALRLDEDGPDIPIFRPRKDELAEPLRSQIETRDRLDREEHWRLLYVALTRAEERLYVGGALGPADRNGPPAASWYAAVEAALSGLGVEVEDDPEWGKARRLGDPEAPGRKPAAAAADARVLPDWIRRSAPVEAKPPRPLAPSSLGEEDYADPPPSAALREAAERGRLLHALFERVPGVPESERAERSDRWLERSAGIADPERRRELVRDACAIVADPLYAELFGPDSLAEAPIAAVIGDGLVVSGTVDRLLVGETRILFADFKTGRRVPERLEDIPSAHLRQMAAYSEALRVIFPGRKVEAKLLYTAGPILHDLPADLLERHLPALAPA